MFPLQVALRQCLGDQGQEEEEEMEWKLLINDQ